MPGRRLATGYPRFVDIPASTCPAVDDLRALITLSRTHSTDCGHRQVVARVDGGHRVKLMYGDAFTLEVQPGAHDMRLHNTLVWKNIHFTIEPGEHLDFLISNEVRWWTRGVVAVLGAPPLFLRVEKRSRI